MNNLALVTYLAIHKTLPKDFYSAVAYEYALREFDENVVCLYGAGSDPAVRATINLAVKKNNPFALFEVGDFFYYGRYGQPSDMEKAYSYYKKSVWQGENNSKEAIAHPLALWTLAYILLYYHVKSSKMALAKCSDIMEIENNDEEA